MDSNPVIISRRRALGLLSTTALGVALVGCGESSSSQAGSPTTTTTAPSTTSSTSTSTSTPATSGTTATSTSCVLQPEVTEGPYYLDLNKVRQDITEGRPGAPLDLQITVVNATTCKPIPNAAVDIWHCDAVGTYSGFGNASRDTTFLRGIQLSDANGLASLQTIYPGWYQGRAVHIHLKVHVGGSVIHTGQLFFDDTLSDTVYQAAPYNTKGNRDRRNSSDSIYSQSGGTASIVDTKANGSRYTGLITVGVKA